MIITRAHGSNAKRVNGKFDRVPEKRRPGGAPIYRKQSGQAAWLYLAYNNKWFVCHNEPKDAREARGKACTMAAVAPGTLPHEVPAGGWQVRSVGGNFVTQPAMKVKVYTPYGNRWGQAGYYNNQHGYYPGYGYDYDGY